jgi:hypothetical protein
MMKNRPVVTSNHGTDPALLVLDLAAVDVDTFGDNADEFLAGY